MLTLLQSQCGLFWAILLIRKKAQIPQHRTPGLFCLLFRIIIIYVSFRSNNGPLHLFHTLFLQQALTVHRSNYQYHCSHMLSVIIDAQNTCNPKERYCQLVWLCS